MSGFARIVCGDADGDLSDMVAAMRRALAAPLDRLRKVVAGGAQGFADPEGPYEDISAVAVDMADVVRDARARALRWTPRGERRAAAPLSLDRLETVEGFLQLVEGFDGWAAEAVRSDAAWRGAFLEACDRTLHACREMRRLVTRGGL